MDTSKRQLNKLIKQVRSAKGSGAGRVRFPGATKDLARDLIVQGYTFSELSETSGINEKTLRSWFSGRPPTGKFNSVRVSEKNSLEVEFPGGILVRGVTLMDLIELLRHANSK